ncbi:dienelactone hydrolase family protein [Haloactinomyces albus]|uniref:Pimeloyl-ACP methyl ester carboxylesterase n=1 Tax=Haloactinomyces albus TaxID=1352928 RepID=A0AAE3ZFV7_9ACTN|nr:dienelactone hydrolase family protein [Haloactinomyces albus]MDR7303225.1 pimeloyl-ACP methyl ester carboxylesterase [Haloactinomyces albus]
MDADGQPTAGEREVSLPAVGGEGEQLLGDLAVPEGAHGLVVFAHGSGSSRRSSRNRWVAGQLQRVGLATLLMDLLSEEEGRLDARTAQLRFDIDFLVRRILGVIDWLPEDAETRSLPFGLFGASTGAAAALGAAAHRPEVTRAVVSRGGRPDLAGADLSGVRAATLLIVGGQDTDVLGLNREAAERLSATHEIHIVDGATHLFEEPGALDEVADVAADWFRRRLGGGSTAPPSTMS